MSVHTMPLKFQKMFYGSNSGGYIDDDISDKPELGPAMKRARTTKIRKYRTYRLILVNLEDVLEFESWIENIAKLTKVAFNWLDPVSGLEKDVRFLSAPTWERIAANAFAYNVTLEDI